VLSWTTRADRPGASFSPPVVVSTGADRLGPVARDAPHGPVAWRSPIAGLDPPERDVLWAAVLQRADGGAVSTRGDAIMPDGFVGLGVPFVRVTPAGVSVLATVAREGVAPMGVAVTVSPGSDAPATVTAPRAEVQGSVEAWEPRTGTLLARVQRDGGSWIEAHRGARPLGRVRVRSPELLVLPRGEDTAAGVVFAAGEFAVGRGDAGACVGQPGGICVRPGRVLLWVFSPDGSVRELEVAPRGVPDALADDGDAVTVLYVEPGTGDSAAQRAARVDVRSGARDSVALSPPEGFPPVDTPRLARCGDELWMVAAITLDASAAARVGVTALPLSCVLR